MDKVTDFAATGIKTTPCKFITIQESLITAIIMILAKLNLKKYNNNRRSRYHVNIIHTFQYAAKPVEKTCRLKKASVSHSQYSEFKPKGVIITHQAPVFSNKSTTLSCKSKGNVNSITAIYNMRIRKKNIY